VSVTDTEHAQTQSVFATNKAALFATTCSDSDKYSDRGSNLRRDTRATGRAISISKFKQRLCDYERSFHSRPVLSSLAFLFFRYIVASSFLLWSAYVSSGQDDSFLGAFYCFPSCLYVCSILFFADYSLIDVMNAFSSSSSASLL